MKNLLIELQAPSKQGRLYWKHDPDIDPYLICLRNPIFRKVAYIINIGGGLAVLDIDSNHIVKRVEINISKKSWVIEDEFSIICRQLSADLSFPNLLERNNEIALAVKVTVDSSYQRLNIFIGDDVSYSLCVELSENCFALVENNYLRGFSIKMSG